MNIFQKHTQAGLLAGLTALFGVTVAFTSAYAGEVVQSSSVLSQFILNNANDVTDSANPFAGAWFDMRSLYSHPCYEIVGIETQMCHDRFGIDRELKSYVMSGELTRFLQARNLFDREKTIVLPQPVQNTETINQNVQTDFTRYLGPTVREKNEEQIRAEEAARYNAIRADRSHILWEICSDKSDKQAEISACYQRNIRLVRRMNVVIEGNVN